MPEKICLRIVNAFDHLLAIFLPISTGFGMPIFLVIWASDAKFEASKAIAFIGSILAIIIGVAWFIGVAIEEMRISRTHIVAIEFLKGFKESLASFGKWLFS